MADVRFKISGGTGISIATICLNGSSCVLQQKSVEYPNTVYIFGGLAPSTTYNVKVMDTLGDISTGIVTTSIGYIPAVPVNKTFSLLGTASCCGIKSSCQILSPKCVNINPTLIAGECVDLHFYIKTYNTNNTLNGITLYCKPYGGCCFTPKASYLNCNNCSCVYDTKTINIKYGDTICYDISTICNGSTGIVCGRSILSISGATSAIGFNAIVNNFPKTTTLSFSNVITTTTTTTLQPVSVGFNTPTIINHTIDCEELSTKLILSRNLNYGESFRLNFTNCALSQSSINICQDIYALACVSINGNSCNVICSELCSHVSDICSCSSYSYIDINSSNINNIEFYLLANTSSANYDIDYRNLATICINSITNRVGANFQLDGCSYVMACNMTCVECSTFH